MENNKKTIVAQEGYDADKQEKYNGNKAEYSISGNRYVKVKNIGKVYGQGNYVVGTDIDSGEYYFWGESMYADIKGKKAHFIDGGFRTCFDAYSRLYANNKIILENGYMTKIDNIVYMYQQGDCLMPRHMYRVGKEIPQGRYSYEYNKSFDYNEPECYLEEGECAFDKYKDEYGSRIYRTHGKKGVAETDSLTKYVVIINGSAILEEAGEFHPSTGPEYENAMMIEYEFRKKLEKEETRKLSDTSKIFEDEYVNYYFSIIDPIAEIVVNEYFSKLGEIVLLSNVSKEDFTHNYKVKLKLSDVDSQCIIYYMFMEHKIQAPACFGVCLANILPMYERRTRDEEQVNLYKAIEAMKKNISKNIEEVLEHYEKTYPFHVLKSSYFYAKYVPQKYYQDYIEEGDHSQYMYYYMREYGRSSRYEKKYKLILLELAEQGLIAKKWKSEFSLYILIKSYFPDAVYQYHNEWLGKQSLDIYVPQIRTGFEYQGMQHYQAVEVFDGEKGFKERQIMDERKRIKCESQNVLLIEWKYTTDINDENLIDILQKKKIKIPQKTIVENVISKDLNENKLKYVIYQYDLKGRFLAEYKSMERASNETKINRINIQRACSGFRDTAGGYQWKKVPYNYSKEDISAIQKKISRGEANKIIQLSKEEKVIEIYNSIAEAVRRTGINSKSIRDAAKGKQRHAGGYLWRYMKNE